MALVRLFALFCLTLWLAACGDSAGPTVTTVAQSPAPAPVQGAAEPRKRIGLVMKTLTNPFFVEMEKGARRAEKDFGIELLVKTAAQETSIEQQIQIVDDLVSEKVNAIVIAPGDSQRLIPVLKKAADHGIKVVNIDNRLDPEMVRASGMTKIPFISVDNGKGAYQAAKYLADMARQPTEAAILEGIRSADNARQRMEGAKRAFADNPLITLVATESANWKIDEAHKLTGQMFVAHPNIKLLFAANDMMALGALRYLQESGKTDVKLAGYDALDEAVAAVKAGGLACTVDQQAAEQGFQGVAVAMRLLKGEDVPGEMLVDTRLVTADRQK